MTKRLLTKLDDMVGLTVTEVRVVHRGEEVIISFADESFILLAAQHYGLDHDDVGIAVENFKPAVDSTLRYVAKTKIAVGTETKIVEAELTDLIAKGLVLRPAGSHQTNPLAPKEQP